MSNSFNISVKPEIAAAVVKIDAIDTVVDAIRATDVPGINTNIDANETKIDTVDTVVDLIRGTDVVNIQTNIDANETKIDTIDGIVDAIKTKTDAMPQMVRGNLTRTYLLHNQDTYQDNLNVTGSGKLWLIHMQCSGGSDATFLITIDGVAFVELTTPADAERYHITPGGGNFETATNLSAIIPTAMPTYSAVPLAIWDVEFDTSLRIQTKRASAGGAVLCEILYFLDNF